MVAGVVLLGAIDWRLRARYSFVGPNRLPYEAEGEGEEGEVKGLEEDGEGKTVEGSEEVVESGGGGRVLPMEEGEGRRVGVGAVG